MREKLLYGGIGLYILNFLAVGGFFFAKSQTALTVWEIVTIVGALALCAVLVELAEQMQISSISRTMMLVFLICACTLTSIAHILNMTVTRKLLAEGMAVPEYLQMGYWPSTEMALDYMAWGFFIGLAFLILGLAIKSDSRCKRSFRIWSIVSGALCLIGFFCAILVNENLWYVAPVGYGLCPIVIMWKMIRFKRSE